MLRTDGSDGGQAFPISVQPNFQFAEPGMSLRDYIATAALPQAVLDCDNPDLPSASEDGRTREEIIASQAYKYADAMVKIRTA